MELATIDHTADARHAARRFAEDLFTVAVWAEHGHDVEEAAANDLLSEAANLFAQCSSLLEAADLDPGDRQWRSFFRRLDAFMVTAVAGVARAAPAASDGDCEAIDRLSDLIAQNADLIQPPADDVRSLAAAYVAATLELRRRFGISA